MYCHFVLLKNFNYYLHTQLNWQLIPQSIKSSQIKLSYQHW